MVRKVYNRYKKFVINQRGAKVHSNSTIDSRVEIANPKGLTLGEKSILYKNITVYNGENGKLSFGVSSHCAPYGYFLIADNSVTIGNDVAIGPHCSFICHSNSIKGESKLFRENYLDGDIIIGNNVFIGAQCTLLPGTVIEDNVVVASNSVVKGRLASNTVYGGSPVKAIKEID